MKREPKGKAPVKPEKVSMNVWCSLAFRDSVQAKVREEGRDVSKTVRRLLRQQYPDLPEE